MPDSSTDPAGPTAGATATAAMTEVVDTAGRLAAILDNSSITRLVVAVGDVHWEMETGAAAPPAPAAVASVVEHLEHREYREVQPAAAPELPGAHVVRAPLVGVCYLQPGPGEAPFVQVGDQVKAGQQLAVVEAMKLMNEVVCDADGVLREVHCRDGEVVEFDEPMFSIETG
jgi:acetyl-CoA carboxylase biotin carboxyl carrier protein